MFRLLLLITISFNLFAQSISLGDLAFIVQKKDKVSIVFAGNVDKTLLVDFPSVYREKSYLPLFRSTLEANNLFLYKNDGVYSVTSVSKDTNNNSKTLLAPPISNSSLPPLLPPQTSSQTYLDHNKSIDFKFDFSSYTLKFLTFDDVKSLLDFSALPYSYSPVSKTLIFKSNKENKKYLSKLIDQIKSIDIKKDQVTLKVTIFDTNQNKIREVGINPSLTFDFNLFSESGALLTGNAVGSFKGSLKFLSSIGASSISTSSSYLIADSEKLDFKKVVSLPFLDEDFALTTDNGTNQSKKYKYKDIGFKVSATPTIVSDTVYLDFSLSVGNVLTAGDLPTTSENTITNKFSVKKGDIVLLVGVSKRSFIDDSESVPFIENIPFIGQILTHKTKNNDDQFLNVSIEIL